MASLRTLIRARPALLLAFALAALAVRLLIPAGAMPASGQVSMTITLCADGLGEPRKVTIDVPRDGGAAEQAAPDKSCGFASLAMGAMDAQIPWLSAAIAFVFAHALLPKRVPPTARGERLRPPLRAPPLIA